MLEVMRYLCVIAFAIGVPLALAADRPVPVVVELFTSEGCSSCPPADVWLQQIDAAQPVPGVRLIVLSEHVDYWNHDGWKDPFSSASISDRQSDYVRALGLKSPYTPQVIVDGTADVRINDAQQVEQTFQKAATIPKLSIRILTAAVDPKNPGVVRVQVEVQGNAITRNADLYEVVALDLSSVLPYGARFSWTGMRNKTSQIATLSLQSDLNCIREPRQRSLVG